MGSPPAPGYLEDIRCLHEQHQTVPEISQAVGVSQREVQACLRQLGLRPHPTSMGHAAAIAFHDACCIELVSRGEPATATRIAEIVGISPAQYSNARNACSGRQVSLDTVARWNRQWAAAGYPPMRIEILGATEVVVGRK